MADSPGPSQDSGILSPRRPAARIATADQARARAPFSQPASAEFIPSSLISRNVLAGGRRDAWTRGMMNRALLMVPFAVPVLFAAEAAAPSPADVMKTYRQFTRVTKHPQRRAARFCLHGLCEARELNPLRPHVVFVGVPEKSPLAAGARASSSLCRAAIWNARSCPCGARTGLRHRSQPRHG